MKYLIYATRNKVTTGAWIDIPVGTSSNEYGRIQKEFQELYGSESYNGWAALYRQFEKEEGVWYDECLAGPDGMSFILFQLPDVSDEQIKKAKASLYHKRDVVHLNVKKIHQVVSYEINQNQ